MKNKNIITILSISLLAASCFSTPQPAGIVKTTNGGADWQFTNKVKNNNTLSMKTVNVSRMDFDPQNRQIVFAGSYNGGLYKSEDAAGSWASILSKISVYDFAINPTDSKIIYAAGLYGGNGKVLKTLDGGASWVEVYNEAVANNAVRSIAINANNPNQIVIGTTSGNIITSNDSGISWKLLKNFEDKINRVIWQNGSIYALLKTKGLQKTVINSPSFVDLTASLNKTYGLGNLNYTLGSLDTYSQVYVDLLQPSLIYVTTNKGLYKTTDEGKTWIAAPLPVKTAEALAKAVNVSRKSSNIVYASVGATIYKSTDGGQSFQTQGVKTGGFVNYVLIDPELPQIAYAGIYSGE